MELVFNFVMLFIFWPSSNGIVKETIIRHCNSMHKKNQAREQPEICLTKLIKTDTKTDSLRNPFLVLDWTI